MNIKKIQHKDHMQTTTMRFLAGLLALTFLFTACKKSSDALAPVPPPVTGNGGGSGTPTVPSATAMKDSVLMISKDIYLWNSQIPASFNAQSYSDPSTIMTAMRPFSMEPGFSAAVDRWSFAMKKTEWDQMSGGMGTLLSTTSEGDFGMSVFFRAEGDLRVRLVEPNAPAGRAGIHRSWKITSINGNSNITTANADFIVNAVYYSTASSFTFLKPDGTTASINLTAANYTEKPVYMDTVYNTGGKKIGYLVFNSFLGNTGQITSEFQRVFNKFSSAGVTDVVVDLRYNGGGYVSLAEQLGNYLVKPSANGNLMMTQLFNSQNTQNNEVTNFRKIGSLNLDDVYFIVGRGTASASELLINNLKPYMDVKLIGPTATHGKPVGFFPIPVGEWYVFPVSFRTTNKNGEGNYFNGIPVTAQVADGLDKDWGDVNESCLASAIRNITIGGFRSGTGESIYQETYEIKRGNDRLNQPGLKITVDEYKSFR
jgi:carboxyl-terminal processing protease